MGFDSRNRVGRIWRDHGTLHLDNDQHYVSDILGSELITHLITSLKKFDPPATALELVQLYGLMIGTVEENNLYWWKVFNMLEEQQALLPEPNVYVGPITE